jgi:hypothetical protein
MLHTPTEIYWSTELTLRAPRLDYGKTARFPLADRCKYCVGWGGGVAVETARCYGGIY